MDDQERPARLCSTLLLSPGLNERLPSGRRDGCRSSLAVARGQAHRTLASGPKAATNGVVKACGAMPWVKRAGIHERAAGARGSSSPLWRRCLGPADGQPRSHGPRTGGGTDVAGTRDRLHHGRGEVGIGADGSRRTD